MYSNLSMFTYCTEALSHSNNPLIEITLRPTKCLLHNRETTLGCGKQTHGAKEERGRGETRAGAVVPQPYLAIFCVWQYFNDVTFLDEAMLG